MLAFVLTALLPQAALGDRVCFDIRAGQTTSQTPIRIRRSASTAERSASGTETTNEVCVWNEPSGFQSKLRKKCVTGVSTERVRGRTRECIWFPNATFMESDNFKVLILGEDALWIDRLFVIGEGKMSFTKQWGQSDNNGWCMSMDSEDYTFWDGESTAENVPLNTCHAMLRFNADASVDGWNTAPLPESELPVMGENGLMYGRTTEGTYVASSGMPLQYHDCYDTTDTSCSGSVMLDEGDRFTVDDKGMPTVYFADGTIIGPDFQGPVTVITPRRRTEMAGEEESELSVEDTAGPFMRLADLLSASHGL